jgi:hypothetical protein
MIPLEQTKEGLTALPPLFLFLPSLKGRLAPPLATLARPSAYETPCWLPASFRGTPAAAPPTASRRHSAAYGPFQWLPRLKFSRRGGGQEREGGEGPSPPPPPSPMYTLLASFLPESSRRRRREKAVVHSLGRSFQPKQRQPVALSLFLLLRRILLLLPHALRYLQQFGGCRGRATLSA